jgi:hypothetical protein
MPVIEPVVTLEKLRLLLEEQHESEGLDYKRTLDLGVKRGVVELAKDVGAMQLAGGFIVIGADDHGRPTGEVDETHVRRSLFDQATLQGKLRHYIPDPFEIRSAVHEIKGNSVVLIYVAPHADGFCIFKADGNYEGGSAFRAGDVFVRHGSASEPWHQQDISRIVSGIVQREKEKWREELREDMRRLQVGLAAAETASGPAAALTWQLDEEAFDATTVELLRRGDDIPIRLLLDQALFDARKLADRDGGAPDLGVLLDRLASLAALTIDFERREDFERVLRAFLSIYALGWDQNGIARDHAPVPAPRLWLMVIERVYALGALAVRRENWHAVRALGLGGDQQWGWDFERYRSWLRHALTMAARANLFSERRDDRVVELSLLSLANRHIERLPRLRPDIPADDDVALTSLCQFDFAAALAVIQDTGEIDRAHFYTNFARFEARRAEPIVVRVIEDADTRRQLTPLDDRDLAVAIAALDRYAHGEAIQFAFWMGFRDQRIVSFLQKNLPQGAPE